MTSLAQYQRHIARANHIILKEVIEKIQNQNNNGKQQ